VVLASAICTKGGKAVISRQYREMPSSRIEGLLASFPKLTSSGQQHTTIETENVRYVYQPFDELYMVLITNRQSNILQDIDTLHLFARVVSDVCRSTDEREILRNSFELLSAFDEIVSLGYRENVNLAQVKSITEMEKHEAKEELKRRAKQLEMQKKEMLKRGSYAEPQVQASFDDGIRSSYNSTPSAPKAKGMQLGKKQKGADLFEAVKSEVGFDELGDNAKGVISISKVPTENVHFKISEKVSLQANRDGDLENMEVKGDLELIVSDANTSKIKISVRATDSDNLQLKTHPNVDKKLFSTENIIALKNPGKGFPVNHPLPVLRWRFINKDEALIPLSISCWSSAAGDGTIDVNIEYELKDENRELTDVVTSIPLPSGGNPTIGEVDGDYELNRQLKSLEWKLPIINSSNKQGTFEFNIPGDDLNAFFPMSVTFISEKLICDIEVLDVINSENESTVTFSEEKLLTVEEYVIV
ncbi:5748_t:CDS:10, partial [Entrophospora sp. SA101]